MDRALEIPRSTTRAEWLSLYRYKREVAQMSSRHASSNPGDHRAFIRGLPGSRGGALQPSAIRDGSIVAHNPHTGLPRDPRDIASDPRAILCVPPGQPIKAAKD